MRKMLLVCGSVVWVALILPLSSIAQDANGSILSAVSAGYAYASGQPSASTYGVAISQPAVLPSRGNFNGWNVSLGTRIRHFVGIAGDFSGLYLKGTQQFPSEDCHVLTPAQGIVCPVYTGIGSGALYTFVAGPRLAFPARRFTPFVDLFFGAAQARDSFTLLSIFRIPIGNPPVTLTTETQTIGQGMARQFAFTDELGGGLAIRLTRKFDWYARVDLLQTHFPRAVPTGTELSNSQQNSNTQNNLQVSTGLAYRFCALCVFWRK
jgi:hypothetical protein